VDVIVNRIRGDLNLSSGAASKALLQAAGTSLQDECSKYRQEHGELMIGDFLVTDGGELCCQYVFHVNIPLYSSESRSSLKVNTLNVSIYVLLEYICVRRPTVQGG